MKHALLLTARDVEVLYDLFVRFNKRSAIESNWITTEKALNALMAVSIELIQICEPLLVQKQKTENASTLKSEGFKSLENTSFDRTLILDSQSIETIKKLMKHKHFNSYISHQYESGIAPEITEYGAELLLKIEASIINSEINFS